MIEIAQNQSIKEGVLNITFSRTNIYNHKFVKGSFDTILAFNILLYFEDIERVLNRMNDLLKPGGTIITSTACLKEKRTLLGILSGFMIYILRMFRILPYLKFLKIKELQNAIATGGFQIIEADVPASLFHY